MKKNPYLFLVAAVVFLTTALLLLYPEKALLFACRGLDLWFSKMIPALFPFMVLSGIMIRMNLTDAFVLIAKPILKPVFQVNDSCLYVIIVGFLCGFPMGAAVTAQLYERNRITKKEAEFLLAFCNNIGPVYFLSFALPLLNLHGGFLFLFGMYGIPLLYGVLLRHTLYKHTLSGDSFSENDLKALPSASFLRALDESVMSALNSITKLGGYMMIFNVFQILPLLAFGESTLLFGVAGACLEITGGLTLLADKTPLVSLILLVFGGFSCLAQTNSVLEDTNLSLRGYFLHRLVLTGISAAFYTVLFW